MGKGTFDPELTPEGEPLRNLGHAEDLTERSRAEEALRVSETRWRALFEQAPDGVFIADEEGRYTDVNSAGCRMLGYSRAELLEKTILDLVPAEEAPRLAEAHAYLRAPGAVQVAEWRLRHASGHYLPVEVSATILPDGRWQAFVRDISARKRAEEELLRSEENLRRAQSVAHVGSWDWELETDRMWRSAELYRLLGVGPAPAFERAFSMFDYIHPDDRARVRGAIEAALRDGRAYAVEHRLRTSDGSEREVVQRGEPVFSGGRTVRMVGTILDITERKRAEAAVAAALEHTRALVSLAPVGIVRLRGGDAAEVEINELGRTLLGIERPTTARDYAHRLLGTDGRPVPFDALPGVRAMRGEHTRGLRMQILHPERGLVPILVNASPLASEVPGELEAIVVFEDISVFEELERLRAEWSSIIAHDLRQPLHAIAVSAQIAADATEDAFVQVCIARSVEAVARLRRMIDDLLDFSRLEARQMRLEKVPLSIASLVEESVQRARMSVPDRPIELTVRGEPVEVDADPVRIAQVLDNLLSNAIKYGAVETPIAVEVERDAELIRVAVANLGADIAARDLEALFERFARTDSAHRSSVEGLGLGLYITRALVEAHAGSIEVESCGGRTTFRFSLPVLRKAEDDPRP